MVIHLLSGTMVLLVMMSMQGTEATALDDYVNMPDPVYSWTNLNWNYRGPKYTLFVINMTSQMWMTDAESSQAIWWHYLYVVVPDRLRRRGAAFLYIGPGNNLDNFIPATNDPFISFVTNMAVTTGSVCALLNQMPNQPIVFNNDPSQAKRYEDAILAWSLYQFINNTSPKWLTILAMTKAAVRAMDTITAFTKQLNPSNNINKFVVGGASKRGWTSWLAGAVDKRVVAIVPVVMDLLNMSKNLHHHRQSLGGWSFLFNDYYSLNITKEFDNPNFYKMLDIADPIVYKHRLTIPKYIITAGGDEAYLPDDSYYYLDQMLGETYLRTVPNVGHILTFQTTLFFSGVQAFYLSILNSIRRPKMTWTMNFTNKGGVLTMFTDTIPLEVNVYYAKTLDGVRRDFRANVVNPMIPGSTIPHPVFWNQTKGVAKSNYQYSATFRNPETGWLVFHIQAFFAGWKCNKYEFTTENMIIPDRLPFPGCQGQECYGTLV